MKLIQTTDAVGHILCHDITQIIPGKVKDARFRKGHIVTEADIPVLLSLGKDHLYIWEQLPQMVHEDDAAVELAQLLCGDNMCLSPVKEGKIEVTADCDGLFQLDAEKLAQINALDDIMMATIHHNSYVTAGAKLAGTRIIPLSIHMDLLAQAKEIASGTPIASLLPLKVKQAAVITTGNEVYYRRIQDQFTPVIAEKLRSFGVSIMHHSIVNDDAGNIADAIQAALAEGAEMIVCTGGMSVDPDDNTPLAIRRAGASIVSYGAPVLPGAMFLLGYFHNRVPVVGLPACAMYNKATVFDLVLPWLLAGVPVEKQDIVSMGHGGLCLGCQSCTYPICPFGKGA